MRNVDGKTNLARRIKRKGPIFLRGYFPSRKNLKNLYFESFLELAGLLHYENDPTINFIDSQPASFLIELDGRLRRYTPDLLIRKVTGELIYVEVKPKCKLNKETVKNKHQALEIALKRLGRQFVTFSEDELSDHKLKNLELLFQGASIYQGIAPDINGALSVLPRQSTVGKAMSVLADTGIHTNVLHYLLFEHYFTVDLDTPLTNDSLIYSNVA